MKLAGTFIYILLFPALLLFLSKDWLWIEGWIFNLWFIALCFITIIYLYKKDPALLNERYKQPSTGNQKGWDTIVVIGLVIGFTLWIAIMPLDAKRFCWTAHFPAWLKVIGSIELMASAFLFFRSYADNTFLSALVRIQSERKHTVVSTGVYEFVRHPMYLAATLLFFGAPMLLGSFYGVIIGAAMVLLLVFRILGEEKMLTNELDGYGEYKKKVRFRIIPFVW